MFSFTGTEIWKAKYERVQLNWSNQISLDIDIPFESVCLIHQVGSYADWFVTQVLEKRAGKSRERHGKKV